MPRQRCAGADIKRRFNKDNFAPLEDFYRERTLQIHVMHEYARLGAESANQASQLVNACFRLPRRRFLRKIDLLEGKSDAVSSDADDRRDTLMQGYKYIFVDEYQDIDEQLYSLVSALAGRRVPAQDAKLIVMAVGDDNQNVLPRA